jgi:hypothetical protein
MEWLWLVKRNKIDHSSISIVGTDSIVTGYVPDGQGVGIRVALGARFLSSPRRPDRFWGSFNLLANGQRG